MIWWYVLTPVVVIALLYWLYCRAMTGIATETLSAKKVHHPHYLQGQPFTLFDGTWAYCETCQAVFQIRDPKIRHQVVPNQYIEVDKRTLTSV